MVLKSVACHHVQAESQSVDERATIEAASIEFTPAIKEDVRSQLFSSVTLEAVGIHGSTKVSVATAWGLMYRCGFFIALSPLDFLCVTLKSMGRPGDEASSFMLNLKFQQQQKQDVYMSEV